MGFCRGSRRKGFRGFCVQRSGGFRVIEVWGFGVGGLLGPLKVLKAR